MADANPFEDDLGDIDLQPLSPPEGISGGAAGQVGGSIGDIEDGRQSPGDKDSLLTGGAEPSDGYGAGKNRDPVAPMPKGSMCSCLTLAYYQQFFDVDTVDVKQRLFQSAVPLKADFFARLDEKPDLYGPFWITTTLIFLLGMASNLASFLSFVPKAEGERWAYDFTLVTFSTSIIYGYVVALPVGLWLLMKYFAVPVRLLSLLCLYGYSLTVLVPVTIICVAPVSWLTWLFTSLAFAVSSSFLCRNLWKVVNEHAPKKMMPIIAVLLGCHGAFFLLFKMYFFSFTTIQAR